MNLEALRTFLQVIETRSLVAASRRLNVTQSTVTARLNALEAEIGQKLLHRGKSGAELTSAGFKAQDRPDRSRLLLHAAVRRGFLEPRAVR